MKKIFPFLLLLLLPLASALNLSITTPAAGTLFSSNNVTVSALLNNATALTGIAQTYGGFDINRSLLAWWTMERNVSTDIIDAGPYSINLSTNGAFRNSTFSHFGTSSLGFPNQSTYGYTNPSVRYIVDDLTYRGFTMSAWFNLVRENNQGSRLLQSNGNNKQSF